MMLQKIKINNACKYSNSIKMTDFFDDSSVGLFSRSQTMQDTLTFDSLVRVERKKINFVCVGVIIRRRESLNLIRSVQSTRIESVLYPKNMLVYTYIHNP